MTLYSIMNVDCEKGFMEFNKNCCTLAAMQYYNGEEKIDYKIPATKDRKAEVDTKEYDKFRLLGCFSDKTVYNYFCKVLHEKMAKDWDSKGGNGHLNKKD